MNKFDYSLHAFRGFALLNVVAVHVFGFALYFAQQFNIDIKKLDRANEVLFHDATIYFTLISGILYALYLSNRSWTAFYKSKLLNVVLPYVFMSIIFTWSHYSFDGYSLFNGNLGQFLNQLFYNLFTGDAIFNFWYIPVLIVLYMLTPVLMLCIKNSISFTLLLLLPLVFSRVWPEISVNTYLYFVGVYSVGLFVGENYEKVIALIQKYKFLLCFIGLSFTIILWMLYTYDVKNWYFISFKESAFYIQKLAIAGLFILLIRKWVNFVPKWWKTLGDYAFAIYFIHGYLLFELMKLLTFLHIKIDGIFQTLILCVITLVFTLVVCVLLAKLLQKIFGKFSRQIVGV